VALGLGAFALTTFLLSAQNAKLTDGPDAWLGFAFAYSGVIPAAGRGVTM